jgi:AMP-polyphosphate phosphotransferase
VQDRSVLLKLYLHLPDKKQEARFHKARQDPHRHYRIHTPDRLRYEAYRGGRHVIDEALRATHRPGAEWHILDTSDRGRLREHFAKLLTTALKTAVERRDADQVALPALSGPELLPTIDVGKDLDRKSYQRRLREAQHDLNKLTDQADKEGLSTLLVFEGVDAAGKGGAIRRLTRAISAEHYEVVPIAAPTPDELNHHYLWRFWAKLPGPGKIKIFDRSWYGRVMVERIEGFCTRRDWQRAYAEINEFEADLIESGVLVMKFWLHIDQDEQARRFAARDSDPLKAFKITEEDLRNRAKWDAYRAAIEEMLARTGTGRAPWHLVPANSKQWARVQVAETVRDALAKAL